LEICAGGGYGTESNDACGACDIERLCNSSGGGVEIDSGGDDDEFEGSGGCFTSWASSSSLAGIVKFIELPAFQIFLSKPLSTRLNDFTHHIGFSIKVRLLKNILDSIKKESSPRRRSPYGQ